MTKTIHFLTLADVMRDDDSELYGLSRDVDRAYKRLLERDPKFKAAQDRRLGKRGLDRLARLDRKHQHIAKERVDE